MELVYVCLGVPEVAQYGLGNHNFNQCEDTYDDARWKLVTHTTRRPTHPHTLMPLMFSLLVDANVQVLEVILGLQQNMYCKSRQASLELEIPHQVDHQCAGQSPTAWRSACRGENQTNLLGYNGFLLLGGMIPDLEEVVGGGLLCQLEGILQELVHQTLCIHGCPKHEQSVQDLI